MSPLSWLVTYIKKLELLYSLKRGSDALRKYLYSSRTEKVLVRVLQKEK